MLGKLPVQFYSCSVPFFGGFLRRDERAEAAFNFFELDVSVPATALGFPYSFESRSVVYGSASVAEILRRRSFANIFPTVVAGVFVPVINFVFGPCSSFPKPNDSVREIVSAFNDDSYSTVLGSRARAFSRFFEIGRSLSVEQPSRSFVIVKEFANKLCRKISVSVFVSARHSGTLAQMPLLVN